MLLTTETPTPVITVTPFTAADGLSMELTPRAAADEAVLPDVRAAYESYEQKGPGWTLRIDGTIVGAAGVMRMWDGVYMGWLLPSPRLIRHPKTVVVAIIEHLGGLLRQDPSIRRIQCTVQADHLISRRMVEYLGFRIECELLDYGPHGETHLQYAWLRRFAQ